MALPASRLLATAAASRILFLFLAVLLDQLCPDYDTSASLTAPVPPARPPIHCHTAAGPSGSQPAPTPLPRVSKPAAAADGGQAGGQQQVGEEGPPPCAGGGPPA